MHLVLDSTMTWEKVISSQERRPTENKDFLCLTSIKKKQKKKLHSFVGAEAVFGWSEAVSAVIPSRWQRCSFNVGSYRKFCLQTIKQTRLNKTMTIGHKTKCSLAFKYELPVLKNKSIRRGCRLIFYATISATAQATVLWIDLKSLLCKCCCHVPVSGH